MKRLLLSLCLVGAVFPGHTPSLLQTTQHSFAPFQLAVEPRAPLQLSGPELPETPGAGVLKTAHRSEVIVRQETTSITTDSQRAPSPIGEGSDSSAPDVSDSEKEEMPWAVVIRWATVHSGPSVSAPTVRFYSVGTELQVVDHQQGWFQVMDPATLQRGWVYEKYYLQMVAGPGKAIMAVSKAPRQASFEEPSKPRAYVRRTKKSVSQRVKNSSPRMASVRIQRESVASILDRALRR